MRNPDNRCVITLIASLVLLTAVPPSFAQQPRQQSPQVTFRTETALIEVEVRVKDRQGQPVAGLEKKDFTLSENGQRQQIANFEFIAPPTETSSGASARTPKSTDPSVAVLPPNEQLRKSTLVYIASWVGPEQRDKVSNAIREFVERQMGPGMLVSIQGAPFTGSKARLLATLDVAGRSKGSHGLVDVQSGTNYSENYATLAQELRDFDTGGLNSIIQDQRSQSARGILLRSIDLVQRLSVYPGSKKVVLFSRGVPIGFRMMPDIEDLLKQLERESLRARVRFFVMGVAGLTALTSESNATRPALHAEDPASTTSAVTAGLQQNFQDSQRGLQILASQTGGEAIVNSNDFGEVFDKVSGGLEPYYVLGYYPSDSSQQGRRRKIQVAISRPGLRLDYRRGYQEDESFSRMTGADKQRQLERAILSTVPQTGVGLTAGYEFFRGANGQPQLAYSFGVALDDPPSNHTAEEELDYSAIVTVRDNAEGRLRGFGGHRIRLSPATAGITEFKGAIDNELQLPATITLPPGNYKIKTVVRNEHNGKLGSIESSLEIPSFNRTTEPSSLMLTTRAAEAANTSPATTAAAGKEPARAESGRGIRAGGVEFFPESKQVFRRGETVYMVYDLYNISAELLAAPPGPRVFLMRGQIQLDRPPFRDYQVFPTTGRNELRYVAKLDTATLEPGDYNLVVPLPNSGKAIFRKFSLIEK